MGSHEGSQTDVSSTKEKLDVLDKEQQPPVPATGDYKSQFAHIDEAKLVRKIDWRIIPVLVVLYVLAFLDRINIGNAAVLGLPKDLHLVGNQLNAALVVFFVPYVLFEIPSNFLLKSMKPHIWLPLCLFGFGLVTITEGLTKNFSGIVTARFFLGLFETGMFPGCYYLISMWYKRSESQKRYTFFFSSTSLAGAFGGLIATGLGKMSGDRGMLGWRWVFIIEGVITCVCAIAMFWLIPDFPEEAKWLSEEEKAFIRARLYEDVGPSHIGDRISWKRTKEVLKDVKVIVAGFMYFGVIVPAYSVALFTPTIIQGLGHSPITTQLLSVPIYACAFVVSMIVAFASDYFKHRFAFIVGGLVVSISGLVILFVVHNRPNVEYGAIFLVASGLFCAMPIILCWFNMNVRGHVNRAISLGYQVGFGNIGGIISSFSFLAKDAPRYTRGYSICTGFICLAIFSSTAYFFVVVSENRKKERQAENSDPDDASSTYRLLL